MPNINKPDKYLLDKLKDPKWRIQNLYYIKNKAGQKVLFKPNAEQMQLINEIWWFNIIPKARQLGITTFFCIYYLDAILFSENKTAMIIAHTRDHAKKMFKEKIRFAYDNLPDWLLENLGETKTDSANEITFSNGSTISVATSGRSGTVQYLHISEFGYTCAHFPDKAQEIVTGTINTVEAGEGMISIESTAEGRDGYFYDFCMEAKKLMEEKRSLSPLQFKLFFFPWWGHPQYALNDKIVITKEEDQYFKDLQMKHSDIQLSVGQKKWYVLKKRTNKEKMMAEYPSTIDEAFSASIQGAYYTAEMAKVYDQQRICRVPYDSRFEVDTWWDLGMNDMNVIVFTQNIGNAIHIIDVYANSGEGLAHYINTLRDKKYIYGTHTLPHDVEVRELGTGVSRKQVLYDLGLTDIRVGKKVNINDGIEKVRGLFSRFYFDERATAPLYIALSAYRKAWDEKRGVFTDKPVHDEHSHYCDTFRLLAAHYREGEAVVNSDNMYDNGIKESSFFDL